MFAGLRELVQEASDRPTDDGPKGPRSGQSNMSPNQEFYSFRGWDHDIPMAQKLFSSPKTFNKVRRSLSSVLAAKSYVYGCTFFGCKNLYNEEYNFKKEPIHPATRRELRFGLKSIVDFIIQMDVENLKTCLHQNDRNVGDFVEHPSRLHDPRFSPDSLFGLLSRTNPNKCKLFFEIIERIVSNLHFSQSLGNFSRLRGLLSQQNW